MTKLTIDSVLARVDSTVKADLVKRTYPESRYVTGYELTFKLNGVNRKFTDPHKSNLEWVQKYNTPLGGTDFKIRPVSMEIKGRPVDVGIGAWRVTAEEVRYSGNDNSRQVIGKVSRDFNNKAAAEAAAKHYKQDPDYEGARVTKIDAVKADGYGGTYDSGDPRLYAEVMRAEDSHRKLTNSGKVDPAVLRASHQAMTKVQAKWQATRKEISGPNYQGKPVKMPKRVPSLAAYAELDSVADADGSVVSHKGFKIQRLSPGTYRIPLGGGREKLFKTLEAAKAQIEKWDGYEKANPGPDPKRADATLTMDSVLARVDAVCAKADFRESGQFGREYGDFEYRGYDVYAGEGDGKWHIYRGRTLVEKAGSKSAAKSAIEGMKPHARKDEAGGSEGNRPFDRVDSVDAEVTVAPEPIADKGDGGGLITEAQAIERAAEPMTIAAGCMVIADNGSVLFMKRADSGQWAFPGGSVEEGEGPAEAALRELFEETGLRAKKHAGLLARRKGDGVDFTTFAVRVAKPFAPEMNHEHTAFAWMKPSDLTGPMVLADSLRADDAANWREEDHPRAKDGKFGSGGGGAKSSEGGGDKPDPGGEGGQAGGGKGAKGGEGAGNGEGGSTASETPAKPPREKAATSLMEKHYDKLPKTQEEREALGAKIAAEVGATELIAEATAKLKALNGRETKTTHMTSEGTYTPERSALHVQILKHLFSAETVARATPKAGEQPTMVMLGGRGGSGKSWFTNKRDTDKSPIDQTKFIVIDSDEFKQALPEFEGWNASEVHEESSDILAMAADIALARGLNVIFDVTMKSSRSVEERIIQFQGADKDYDVQGYYMHASPEKATRQAIQRFKSGVERNGKGRFVPPDIILSNVDNEKNFDKAKASFSKWAVYDNNGSGGPRLHASSDDED